MIYIFLVTYPTKNNFCHNPNMNSEEETEFMQLIQTELRPGFDDDYVAYPWKKKKTQ